MASLAENVFTLARGSFLLPKTLAFQQSAWSGNHFSVTIVLRISRIPETTSQHPVSQ